MNTLFSDEEGSVGRREVQLTINEHYAKAFEFRKEREELERLKAKYGSDYDPDTSTSELSTDSESAESEDEDGEELTPTVDAAILRTLARIKERDPAIYDSSKHIFGEEQEKIASKSVSTKLKPKDKSKPVTMRQAKLESMLYGSRSLSPDDADVPRPATYVEEQENLRKETIVAFQNAIPEGEGDDFLVPREKTKDELEIEEEEYRAFLEREIGDLKKLVSFEDAADAQTHEMGHADEANEHQDVETGSKKAKANKKTGDQAGVAKWKKTQAEKDQEFLMNYILNRGWIDRSERHVPTYDEVISTKRRKKGQRANIVEAEGTLKNGLKDNEVENLELDTGNLSDSSFDSLASHFEASYNHRFEEPGAATIPTFPRDIQSTVRRQDTTRKAARERKKTRKEEEHAKKREEVKRLKALKMREVRRKLEMIGRQAGLKMNGKGKGKEKEIEVAEEEGSEFMVEALCELDLEGDWDSEKHDRQMAGLFERDADAFEDDDAWGGADDEDDLKFDEDGKPVWDDDIDIGDITVPDDDGVVEAKQSKKEKKKKRKKKKDWGGDETGVDMDAMDADVEPAFEDDEVWDGTEEMRKRVLKTYMDKMHSLDFNDMVGDLPTRFKYFPVEPSSYSLTPAEILRATDKELNDYVSVKKYAPYRLAKADKHRFSKTNQEKLRELKSKIAERTGGVFRLGGDDVGGQVGEPKKRKGKKERMKMKAAVAGVADAGDEDMRDDSVLETTVNGDPDLTRTAVKRKRGRNEEPGATDAKGTGHSVVSGEMEDAPKKKRKRKHRKEGESVGS